MTLTEILADMGYYLNDTSSIRYDSTLRTRMANIAYFEYYNDLVKAGHQGLLTTPQSLNLVSGTATVALPSDFFMIYKLSKVLTSSRKPLNPKTNLERSVLTSGASAGDAYLPDYSVQGSNILLQPVPSESKTGGLYLEYFPIATAMTTGSTTPATGFSAQFHPLIPLKASILIKATKEDEDVSSLKMTLNDMERPFRQLITSLTKQRKKTERFII